MYPNSAIRGLFGMQYKSAEFSHKVTLTTPEILRGFADWLEDNEESYGLLTSISTQSNPDDEDEFLTTLVWAL